MEQPILPFLVQPESLNERLHDPDLLIVHVGSFELYEDVHIPGAHHLNPRAFSRQAGAGQLPTAASLSAVFSKLGLSAGTHVVAYDEEGGGWASRLLWTLHVLGHERISLLDGGLVTWLAEGWPTGDEQPALRSDTFHAQPNPARWLTGRQVRTTLGFANTVLVDARSAAEFEGHDVRGARGGRIPGAVHLDWRALMDRKRHLRLQPVTILRDLFEVRGVTHEQTVVVYCQTHHRSSLTWAALRVLRYPHVLAYPGSWAHWSSVMMWPVESGPLLDYAALANQQMERTEASLANT